MKKGNENLLLIVFGIIVTLILMFVALSISKPDEIRGGEPIGNSKPVERLQITGSSYMTYFYNSKCPIIQKENGDIILEGDTIESIKLLLKKWKIEVLKNDSLSSQLYQSRLSHKNDIEKFLKYLKTETK